MTEEEFRKSHPHIFEIPMEWGDMDAIGHLNNAIYFRYMENARIAYFLELNIETPDHRVGEGPVLANISCQFMAPVSFPDKVLISSSVYHIGNTSFKMRHTMYSTSRGLVCAEGDSVIVMINYKTGVKVRISDEIREKVAHLEGSRRDE